MTTARHTVKTGAAGYGTQQKLRAFAGILVVLFLVSLNLTVVGTSLPRIIAELQGFALYAWAFTAYSLTSTVSLPVYGRLSDLYGRKRVLLFGIVLFAAASALGGVSQTMLQLVLLRALQGLGGGALISMAWATIADIFEVRERSKYQGLTGAVFGVSSVIGPLAGGLITDGLGWRWVFFVNVPVAAIAFYMIRKHVPSSRSLATGSVDYLGSVLVLLGMAPLLLALSWGGVEYPWVSWPLLLLLAVTVVALGAFAWWQGRSQHPLVDPSLLRNRTFLAANIGEFLSGFGLFGAVIYLPLFIQGVQGASAAASGFALAPLMLGLLASSVLSGVLVNRTGRYKAYLISGLVLMAIGFLCLSTINAATGLAVVTGYSVLLGLGIGPTSSLFLLAAQNATPADRLGTVTSTSMFFRQVGGTIGVALLGALIAVNLGLATQEIGGSELSTLPSAEVEKLASVNILTDPEQQAQVQKRLEEQAGASAFPTVLASLRAALGTGLSLGFILAAALSVLALLAALSLPQLELRTQTIPAAEEEVPHMREDACGVAS